MTKVGLPSQGTRTLKCWTSKQVAKDRGWKIHADEQITTELKSMVGDEKVDTGRLKVDIDARRVIEVGSPLSTDRKARSEMDGRLYVSNEVQPGLEDLPSEQLDLTVHDHLA